MINIVIMIIVVFVINIVYKSCIKKDAVIINHILCFSVGYLYYGIFPLIILENGIAFRDYTYNNLLKIYTTITIENKLLYLFISFLWYATFILASNMKKISFKKNRLIFKKYLSKVTFNYSNKLFYIPVIILGILFLYLNRNSLFTGYSTKYTSEYKGSLSAYVIMVFSILLLYYFSNINISTKKMILNKWAITYILFAVLLLTMGGRLYVTSNIVAFLIFYSSYKKNGIKITKAIFFLLIALFAVGIIGILRSATISSVSLQSVLFNLVQEPIYTSYSLVTYLAYNNIFNLISFPIVLFSSFINLIPHVIFPQKSEFLTTIYDLVPSVKSPLGATHNFVSYNVDFGILLNLIFLFYLGNCLGDFERNRNRNAIINNVVYCLMSSNLMFTFFRDGVSTSLVKNLFEYSFLIPVLVIVINNRLARVKN